MSKKALSEDEIKMLLAQAKEYVLGQRRKFILRAAPLSEEQVAMLQPFFSDRILREARLVELAGESIHNPAFIAELRARGYEYLFDLNHLNAASFGEVLVFHGTASKRLLFHAMVHSVQQKRLGMQRWLELYVRALLKTGLHVSIPLEVQAYEMDGRFALNQAVAFFVEKEVEMWIAEERY
jgi:hypothetical protein